MLIRVEKLPYIIWLSMLFLVNRILSSSKMNIEPFSLAKKNKTLSGKICQSKLKNFSQVIEKPENNVSYTLNFKMDETNRPVIFGNVSTRVALKCNRCLKLIEQPINADIMLYPVASESSYSNLPEGVDGILADKPLNFMDILEEELILALPLVARHIDGDANCTPGFDNNEPKESSVKASKVQPFAKNSDLMKLKELVSK